VSLRAFHLVFILLVIIGAEMFGAWAIWHYPLTGDLVSLGLGSLSLLGGLGLAAHSLILVRKMDRADLGAPPSPRATTAETRSARFPPPVSPPAES
jgi:hypothetical protein